MAKKKQHGEYDILPSKTREYNKQVIEKFKEFNENGKKTICYFCDTYYPILDGVIVVMNNYARLLSKEYNVVVCVPKHKSVITTSPDYLVVGVESLYFKFVNYDLAFPEMDNIFKNLLKKLRIDIIHSHSPFNMGTYATKLAKKRKIPLVCTFHSQYKKDFYKSTQNETISKMLLNNIMKNFKAATEVWTMNNQCIATLREYGYDGKVYLVPNSTDKKRPENLDELKKKADAEYGTEKIENVFIFVGRLVSQKNIYMIPHALKILKDRGIPFKMFYVGTGPDEAQLRKTIKEVDLENEITLLGRVPNEKLDSLFARAKLMLFPSEYDTSSLTQIESAAFDTPSVLIKDSVTAGTVTDNQNGFLSINTPEAYAERIIEILENKDLYEKVKANVYPELYVTHESVAERVSERYKYLLAQNERRNEKIKTLTKNGKNFDKKYVTTQDE